MTTEHPFDHFRNEAGHCLFCTVVVVPGAASPTRLPTVELMDDIEAELTAAMASFAPFNSPHEGWAVIREELDELWDHVRANTGETEYARREAIQIAAMAMRYALDLTPGPARTAAERKKRLTYLDAKIAAGRASDEEVEEFDRLYDMSREAVLATYVSRGGNG